MEVKLGTWSGSIWVRCWVGATAGVDATSCRTQTAVSAHTNRSISHPAQLLTALSPTEATLTHRCRSHAVPQPPELSWPPFHTLSPTQTHNTPFPHDFYRSKQHRHPKHSTVTSKHAVTLKFSTDLRENTQHPGLRVCGDAMLCQQVAPVVSKEKSNFIVKGNEPVT